jgi:hypothetical protein
MSSTGPSSEPALTADAPLLAGRYQLLEPIGQGGMGTVYRARDVTLNRPVAVKVLPAGKLADPDAVARFRREATALARLSHPNIVQAHDSGADGERHFLVMELVEGRSLAAVLAAEGKVAPTRAAGYAHQAARALHHAHRSGLIHRDVKPSNLLLMPDGTVKLLDLGLARFLQDQVGDASLTRAGAGMGTPDYCAPEQCRNAHSAGPAADVYALGCTLYHLLAGRVPFPGSSLSEKVQAHEARDPTPLEDLCPEVPGGLALAVARLMAKRPQDRFGSMAEAAEALAPYVAASSPSYLELRTTSAWDGSQLTTAFRGAGRRRRWFALVAGALLALAAVGVGWLGARSGWFGGPKEVAAGGGGGEGEKEGPRPPDPAKPRQPSSADDPNVLTVSQKKEGGGKYRSIAEALDKVRPHQTIRIVDKEVYREDVKLKLMAKHEGVTLEAPAGAVLEPPGPALTVITVSDVRGVTLRDLRLRRRGPSDVPLVELYRVAGITLEGVDLDGLGHHRPLVVVIDVPSSGARDVPAVVFRRCRFLQARVGISLTGALADSAKYGVALPVCGVAVRENLFQDCEWGVYALGAVRGLQVVGNRFRGCSRTACQFEHLIDPIGDILVANNTALDCALFLRVWDEKVRGRDIRVCNNLSLATPYPDLRAYDSGGHPSTPRGWGDGEAYTKLWSFSHNWREVKSPEKRPAEPDGWVPPGKLDEVRKKIDVERDAGKPDYLRPKPGSPLATQGAGQVDPTLPSYVGAVPPEGVDPWDWDRAWRMPKGAVLLTVSKAGGGGEYPSIGKALEKARPWATIRIQDAETYDETIRLDDAEKHTGLTLEAPKGATLRLVAPAMRLINIRDVPDVCVRGFTLVDDGVGKNGTRAFAVVQGKASGVVLARLHLAARNPMLGIWIVNAGAAPGGPPLRVERCTIRPKCPASSDGINVSGTGSGELTRGVVLSGNEVHRCFRGIVLSGLFEDVHVVGNVLVGSQAAALHLQNLAPASRGLLVANNTAFSCNSCLRVWDDLPAPEHRAGQVEVVNNLFFDAHAYDVGCVEAPQKGEVRASDGAALLERWRFHHNGRDFAGAGPAFMLRNARDIQLPPSSLLAVDADNPRLTRPRKSSPLATQGAGAKGGDLPAYIGALPPKGEPAWDWARTWRARRPR